MGELEEFLAPVDHSNPSGVELRNDARFHALERSLEPAARSARVTGDSATPRTPPIDWDGLLKDAAEMARAGRDLRLLVMVTRMATHQRGLEGLGDALSMLTATVEQCWDHLHPALRDAPSPREAALRRINALYQLENTDNGLMADLALNTVFTLRGIGAVTGSDLAAVAINRATVISEAADGLGEKEKAALAAAHEAQVARTATALKALATERPEEVAALAAAAVRARAALSALEAALDARVAENGVGVRFAALGTLIGRIAQSLAGAEAAPAGAAAPQADAASAPVMPAPEGGAAIPGQITSRREVERCLDLIIDFYERTEPSSPLPHLARRMRKMVPMTFMQLMEEIAPSGMKEFRAVAGVIDEKSK